jgi:hypothetical protein
MPVRGIGELIEVRGRDSQSVDKRPERWTTDAWAPLDGRAINAGVRLDL